MQAKREGLSDKAAIATQEDNLAIAGKEYLTWRMNNIRSYFSDCARDNATDHSTIMTNSMHARKALAYDVAIGVSHLLNVDLRSLRTLADWRLLKELPEELRSGNFIEYFDRGTVDDRSVFEWARLQGNEGRMPSKIIDRRENPPPRKPLPKGRGQGNI
jgi:hypothetical protein